MNLWPTIFAFLVVGGVYVWVFRTWLRSDGFSISAPGFWCEQQLWTWLLIVPLACTLPLYVVAIDYGRWFVSVFSVFTLCVSRMSRIVRPIKSPGIIQGVLVAVSLLVVQVPNNLGGDTPIVKIGMELLNRHS
jgi:hypothetical protein